MLRLCVNGSFYTASRGKKRKCYACTFRNIILESSYTGNIAYEHASLWEIGELVERHGKFPRCLMKEEHDENEKEEKELLVSLAVPSILCLS